MDRFIFIKPIGLDLNISIKLSNIDRIYYDFNTNISTVYLLAGDRDVILEYTCIDDLHISILHQIESGLTIPC